MPRLQKRIATCLVLYLILITALCLISVGGPTSSVNQFAVTVGLKGVVAAPTIETGRYGLSIISKESIRPNIPALLVYAILGVLIASTLYSLQPKVGGLSSGDWVDVGRRMTDSGYYEEAIDAYSIAAQLNPRGAKAYAERGVAYHKLGDYERAVSDYHTALRIKPILTEYYQELGDYFNSLKLVAGHGSANTPVLQRDQRDQAPSTDFLWCPNCFLAMKVAKGSRGVFNCPKCKHEFFA